MKKDFHAQELQALLPALSELFEQVELAELPDGQEEHPGLRVQYERSLDDLCAVITRGLRVDGKPCVLRLSGVLADAAEAGASVREMRIYHDELVRDLLTGTYNLSFWNDRICAKLNACAPAGRPAAMALLEIDGYEQLKQQYDEADMGQVVCYVANLWKRYYDEGDEKVVCRLDENRFAIVCFGAEEIDLESQMRFVYEKMNLVCTSTHGMLCRIPFTLSMACAGLNEPGCTDTDTLYKACAARLDGVKAAGGNAVAKAV